MCQLFYNQAYLFKFELGNCFLIKIEASVWNNFEYLGLILIRIGFCCLIKDFKFIDSTEMLKMIYKWTTARKNVNEFGGFT